VNIKSPRNYCLNKYKWLEDRQVYFCASVGLEDGINTLRNQVVGKVTVVVGEILGGMHRAFSHSNPIWNSADECRKAEEWAKRLGEQLLLGVRPYNPQRDALGWCGCQALVAFHHNIPNDTLPMFWATGKREGKSWIPLFDRHD
jgi:hypothetical protein